MGLKDFFKTYFSNIRFPMRNEELIQSNDELSSFVNYEKYKDIITKHFELSDKIQITYSIAINQENIFNMHTEKCINLCLEDIKLAPIYKKYLDSGTEGTKTFYGMYVAFPTLAKIYEKKGEIDKAILICTKAIKLGFTIDHSKGGIQGRLARLIKKHNQKYPSKIQYDYENNILYNDETGEPLP